MVKSQQFYQDLDLALDYQAKDVYIADLIRLCKDDHNYVNDYRERLAERAQQNQTCQETNL